MPRETTPDAIDARNIVLTGFMGTGKTTVGRLLADRLGYEFVDTDRLIESRHGSISSIFADEGEARFRAIEREVAIELGDRRHIVISSGGRMLLDATNAAALTVNGRVFCLVASVPTIVERVAPGGVASDRPLLRGHDVATRVAELLDERAPQYEGFEQVATDGSSPAQVCADIVLRLTL
jgi:shikimate kinase